MIQEIISYLKIAYQINPIGQIIGFIGFILSVIAFLNKNDKQTKIIHAVALSFWGIHFFLLGLYTAVAVDIVGVVRNFLSVRYKGNNKILIVIIIVYLLFGFITFKNIYSLLPVISGIFANFAFFKLKGIKFRTTLLFCSFLWLTYNMIGHSIGGIITEVFLETAAIITITRLFIDKNKGKRKLFGKVI